MEPRVIIFGTAVILVLAIGIISFVVVFMQKQRQQYKEMTKLKDAHQLDLLTASVDAQENVRRQIGGDLHDDIGTLLSTTRLSLAQLGRQIKSMPETEGHFGQTNELLNQAISNVRRISKELMPSSLDEFGLGPALEDFSEKLTLSTGVNVFFDAHGLRNVRFLPKIELILYRIIQELTNNSLKHAKATQIDIDLSKIDNTLHLVVKDNGIGFDKDKVMKNPKNGIGIRNIEGRLSVINGKVFFDVANGRGSVILVDVNLDTI
jgi:signal transduction histidine kinase